MLHQNKKRCRLNGKCEATNLLPYRNLSQAGSDSHDNPDHGDGFKRLVTRTDQRIVPEGDRQGGRPQLSERLSRLSTICIMYPCSEPKYNGMNSERNMKKITMLKSMP